MHYILLLLELLNNTDIDKFLVYVWNVGHLNIKESKQNTFFVGNWTYLNTVFAKSLLYFTNVFTLTFGSFLHKLVFIWDLQLYLQESHKH